MAVSGLENAPASAGKPGDVPFASVPGSRVAARGDVSGPDPESLPSPSANVTEVEEKYGADAPVSVIVWPVGAAESAAIATASEPALPALSVAVTFCEPGAPAPEVQRSEEHTSELQSHSF